LPKSADNRAIVQLALKKVSCVKMAMKWNRAYTTLTDIKSDFKSL